MSGILIIDDDSLIRMVVAENLADAGYTVRVASSERLALEVIEANPDISVCLVDYCLPQPIGINVCRNIRARHPRINLALFTGHEELAQLRRGDLDIAILPKVIRTEHLIGAIEALLAGRKPASDEGMLESRASSLWRRQQTRETVKAVGRALHNVYDGDLRATVPGTLRATIARLTSGRD